METTNTKKDIIWRLYLAFVFICLGGILISAQIFRIQFVQGDEYRSKADSLRTRFMEIGAERGSIYADNGDLLAASFPYYDIIMDPCAPSKDDFKKHIDSLALRLSQVFPDHSASQYKQMIATARNEGKRYLKIKTKVTLPQKEQVAQMPLFRLGKNKGGLITEQIERRTYPYGTLANRTIGYTRDNVKVGLEGKYDSVLAGTPGHKLMRRIAGGNWIPIGDNDENQIDPVNGLDLVTTLDINIQDITDAALRRTLVTNNAAWGTAIVMEVKTGEIKAISNLTREEPGVYEERLNYAISERVEPGSTWKLFTLMSLFDDGYITLSDSVDLHNGEFHYADRTMWDSEGRHGRRNVPVKTAFAISSNVGISRLAYKYYQKNPSQYIQHIKDAGLNQVTGIEITGEPAPIFKTDPKADNWYSTTIPWMSVGYELQITPLQLLTFYNAIANNGKLMKPYLVSETRQYGKTVEKFKPVVLNEKICSDKTVDELKQCMLAVVDSGTAKHLKNTYYQFAGKTGTAQIFKNGAYGHDYLATFAGYFPADDPKYSIIVMVNSPSNGVYYGGYVSAPVFREIADKIYSHYVSIRQPVNAADSLYEGLTFSDKGYTSDFAEILNWFGNKQKIDERNTWIQLNAKKDTLTFSPVKDLKYTMPDVRGMGLRDALFLLENDGLKVDAQGVGKVVYQSITPGSAVGKNTQVTIRLQ